MFKVELVHQTESSIGTKQIKEKASQNIKNVFSRMLLTYYVVSNL